MELRKELINYHKFIKPSMADDVIEMNVDNYLKKKSLEQIPPFNPEIPKPICYHPQEWRTSLQGEVFCRKCNQKVYLNQFK